MPFGDTGTLPFGDTGKLSFGDTGKVSFGDAAEADVMAGVRAALAVAGVTLAAGFTSGCARYGLLS